MINVHVLGGNDLFLGARELKGWCRAVRGGLGIVQTLQSRHWPAKPKSTRMSAGNTNHHSVCHVYFGNAIAHIMFSTLTARHDLLLQNKSPPIFFDWSGSNEITTLQNAE